MVFLTMEIESQLAPAGIFDAPLVNWLMLVNYLLLDLSLTWTMLSPRWLKQKSTTRPPPFVFTFLQVGSPWAFCKMAYFKFYLRFVEKNQRYCHKIWRMKTLSPYGTHLSLLLNGLYSFSNTSYYFLLNVSYSNDR